MCVYHNEIMDILRNRHADLLCDIRVCFGIPRRFDIEAAGPSRRAYPAAVFFSGEIGVVIDLVIIRLSQTILDCNKKTGAPVFNQIAETSLTEWGSD